MNKLINDLKIKIISFVLGVVVVIGYLLGKKE